MTEIDSLGTPSLPRVVLTQAFDAVGNRLSVSANVAGTDDYQNDYQYDGLHRMIQVTQQGQTGGNTVAEKRVDFSYNNFGQFTEITRYSDLVGTNEVATSTYQYDTNARLVDLSHQHDTTTIAQYTWTYDNLNRISSFTSPDADVTYQYDETGQLTGADYDTASGITDESYQYDLAGNRINTGYSTGANNQLLSDGTYNYTYDNEGNRSTRIEIATGELTEYSWDHRNRLTSVVTKNSGGTITHQVDYTYDLFNRRIIKSIDADGAGSSTATEERYIYDGDHIALVYDQTNQLTNRLLHGPAIDQVLADEQFINGLFDEVLWPLTDHLGSVRDLIDNDGNIENHIVYDSFGNIISETNTSIDHLFGYTGRETDEETDLYYYRNRYYDAAVGRFISEDPIGFNAGDVNIVRYVGNQPSGRTDPLGLDWYDRIDVDPVMNDDGTYHLYWQDAGMLTDGNKLWVGKWDPSTNLVHRHGLTVGLSQIEAIHGWWSYEPCDYSAWNKFFATHDLKTLIKSYIGADGKRYQSSTNGALINELADPNFIANFQKVYKTSATLAELTAAWYDIGGGLGRVKQAKVFIQVLDHANSGSKSISLCKAKSCIRNLWSDAVVGLVDESASGLSRIQLLAEKSSRNLVVLDENVFFMDRELIRQGYKVLKVTHGAKDPLIRAALECSGARFVTRNYNDFKGLPGVVRVSGTTPTQHQLLTTVNSLEIARHNPEVFLRMKQIPASGINKGLVKPPR